MFILIFVFIFIIIFKLIFIFRIVLISMLIFIFLFILIFIFRIVFISMFIFIFILIFIFIFICIFLFIFICLFIYLHIHIYRLLKSTAGKDGGHSDIRGGLELFHTKLAELDRLCLMSHIVGLYTSAHRLRRLYLLHVRSIIKLASISAAITAAVEGGSGFASCRG